MERLRFICFSIISDISISKTWAERGIIVQVWFLFPVYWLRSCTVIRTLSLMNYHLNSSDRAINQGTVKILDFSFFLIFNIKFILCSFIFQVSIYFYALPLTAAYKHDKSWSACNIFKLLKWLKITECRRLRYIIKY